MEKVYILTHGFRYSSASVVGVFSSMENARQRQREILSNLSKDLYPEFFRIDSIVLNVGKPITEECTQFDHKGNIIT
ncbi:DUF7336 domain-containing protein [Serratia sp. NPDC078593]|uniref:DUF7336 domain-containing protein n=1 Tax=unclassified Serratia (in: enterobacteria) TaxID=2647522 RepID=UPI003D055B1F